MSWRYEGVIRIRISKKNRQHSVLDIRIMITPLVSSRHYVVCSSLKYEFDYPFGIFKTLCCLFFFEIRILITPLYLQDIVLSILNRISKKSRQYNVLKIPKGKPESVYQKRIDNKMSWRYKGVTDPDHPFDILKTLWCLFFFDIWILITQLYLQDIVLSVLHRITDSDSYFKEAQTT
jgi:hypothetical protein